MVHPAVHRDHHQRAGEAGEDDGEAAEEMHARRETAPSVRVDADEDRLEEEREALDREAEPEHAAERAGERGPQQPHLEAEDRAGDDAGREQRGHDLRPPPRDRAVNGIAGAEVPPLEVEHERRERDAEADERDVHRERERLHLPGLVEVLLRRGCERRHDVVSITRATALGWASIERCPASGISTKRACMSAAVRLPAPTESTVSRLPQATTAGTDTLAMVAAETPWMP